LWLGGKGDTLRDMNFLIAAACLLISPLQDGALSESKRKELDRKLSAWFNRTAGKGKAVDLSWPRFGKLSAGEHAEVKERAWRAYQKGSLAKKLAPEFKSRAIQSGKYTMPFSLEKRGKRPADGWPVLIAMHGGGGVPKKVNDSQWEIMKKYYRVTNCIYIAPRAPTDEWNGFYTGYIYPLVDRLIRALNLFEEVNPNRIYLIGYSHGGYGAFAIGPKMADRFAAVHASASAPTDGQSAAENLMNTHFSFRIGENDTAYGRLKRCRAFHTAIEKLKKENPGFYPVTFEYMPGKAHVDLGDWTRPVGMFKERRNPNPKTIRWKLTDNIIQNFFWLRIEAPKKGMEVLATISGNRIDLTTTNVEKIALHLPSDLLPKNKRVLVTANGKRVYSGIPKPSLETLCKTLEERGDPSYLWDREIEILIPKENSK